MWLKTLCLENTLIMNSCARSAEIQVTSVRIKMTCLENQLITIRMKSEDANARRDIIESC